MQLTLRDFFMRLPLVTGIGPKTCVACWHWLMAHPQIQAITTATLDQLGAELPLPAERLKQLHLELFSHTMNQQITENLTHSGCLTIVDQAYPPQLKEIYTPPVALFFQGDLRILQGPQLAVVGSRHPTKYAFHAPITTGRSRGPYLYRFRSGAGRRYAQSPGRLGPSGTHGSGHWDRTR